MRILSATTRSLKIGALKKDSNAHSLIGTSSIDVEEIVALDNAFLVLVCVELGDNIGVVKSMTNRIEKLWEACRGDFGNIVLVPFGHLSDYSNPSLEDVYRILNKMQRILKNKGVIAETVKPNQANYLFSEMMIFDSGSSVRYSSSANSLRDLLKDILRTYGVKNTMNALANLLKQRESL